MSFRTAKGSVGSVPPPDEVRTARGRVTVTDARALSALAHPLRQRLLHHLMRTGPATASQCAEALGDSPSNCSYHLRLLSRHGFVERAEGADGRDRPWRAVASGFDFMPRPEDPGSVTARAALLGVELAELMRLYGAFFDGFGDLDPRWQRASAFNSYALSVTPDELAHLVAVIDLLVRPYIITERADAPASSREAAVNLQAILRPEVDRS